MCSDKSSQMREFYGPLIVEGANEVIISGGVRGQIGEKRVIREVRPCVMQPITRE